MTSTQKVPPAPHGLGRLAVAWALAAVLAAAVGAPAQAAPKVIGIDVSRFNEEIDWGLVDTDRIRFAFVQASRGSGEDCTVKPRRCGADRFYDFNYAAARGQGIRVGAYHRAFVGGETRGEVRRDAAAEARLFIRSAGHLRRGDLLPALDVEWPYAGLSPRLLRAWVGVWLRRVRAAFGVRPIIYTSRYGWEPTGDTRYFALAGHRLWVAHWEVRSPLVPAGNWAGRGWAVWQFSSSGQVHGISGPVDLNRLGVPLASITIGLRRKAPARLTAAG